jgi:P pilus assembly chaperone PapD
MTRLALILFLVAEAGQPALAFTVSPMTADLEPAGKRSTATFQVKNPGASEASVAVYIKTRKVDDLGEESREEFDVGKSFLVLPSTLTIGARSAASIRVVYIGPRDAGPEKAYRIIFASLTPQPMVRGGGATSVKIDALVSYAGTLYVGQAGGKARIEASGPIKKDGKTYFRLENKGTKRASFAGAEISVSAKNLGAPEVFRADQIKSLKAPLFPGASRLLQLPGGAKADPDSALIKINDWQ